MIYFAGAYPSSLDRVPICGQYCDHWFDACKDDLSCVTNWVFDWEYADGQNKCPSNSTCTKFSDRYADSTELCNVLWGNTYNYTQENELCYTPNYYKVNTLVTDEIFGEQCGLSESGMGDEENGDDTMLVVGIVMLVIGVLLTIIAGIWVYVIRVKGKGSIESVRQQSTAIATAEDTEMR